MSSIFTYLRNAYQKEKRYLKEAADIIAEDNRRMLLLTNLIMLLFLIALLFLTPYIIKDWKPTDYHLIFLPVSLLCLGVSYFSYKKKLTGKKVTAICAFYLMASFTCLFLIDPATLEDYAIYMADYATGNADEIAMFQVKESDQMTTVKSLINDRISDLKVRYEDYKPEEMPKIESAIIEEKGNYIFLVISPDNEKAQEVLDQLLG